VLIAFSISLGIAVLCLFYPYRFPLHIVYMWPLEE